MEIVLYFQCNFYIDYGLYPLYNRIMKKLYLGGIAS